MLWVVVSVLVTFVQSDRELVSLKTYANRSSGVTRKLKPTFSETDVQTLSGLQSARARLVEPDAVIYGKQRKRRNRRNLVPKALSHSALEVAENFRYSKLHEATKKEENAWLETIQRGLEDLQLQRPNYRNLCIVVFVQLIFVAVGLLTVVLSLCAFIYSCVRLETPSLLDEGSVQDKVEQFKVAREQSKRQHFWRMVLLGILLGIIGNVLLTLTTVFIVRAKPEERIMSEELGRIVPLQPLASTMIISAIFIISTIPTAEMDFDKMAVQFPLVALAVTCAQFIRFLGVEYSLSDRQLPIGMEKAQENSKAADASQAHISPTLMLLFKFASTLPDYVDCFFPVPLLYGCMVLHSLLAFGGKLGDCWPAYTTLFSMSQLFLAFGYAWEFMVESLQIGNACKDEKASCHEQYNRSESALLLNGAVVAVASIWIAWQWYRTWRLHRDVQRRIKRTTRSATLKKDDDHHPTVNFYHVVYQTYFLRGCAILFKSVVIFFAATFEDWQKAEEEESVSQHPFWLLQRAEEGLSYVVIPLLVVAVGRERVFRFSDEIFENKHATQDGAFMAELLEQSTDAQVGQSWWLHHGAGHKGAWSKIRQHVGGADYSEFDARQNWHAGVIVEVTDDHFDVELRSNLDISKVLATERVLRPDGGLTASELLELANKNLRCIDWENLSFELMSGQTVGGRVGGDFSLSRPVRKGEKIDFFLSHSWHDDATTKYAKMTEVVNKFYATKQRYPTFWLDKVCIDQSRISDGLKVLPVNVMACSQMLVMWGRTYPHRLWCAWELCTLFSFMSAEQAATRLKLVPIGDSGDMFALLRAFNVADAHCYDPNEEMRLRTIVAAVGENRFNQSIRRIGESGISDH